MKRANLIQANPEISTVLVNRDHMTNVNIYEDKYPPPHKTWQQTYPKQLARLTFSKFLTPA